MIRKIKIISLILFVGLLWQSCDKNRYFEQNSELENSQWYYKNTKEFKLSIDDTLSLFNFNLNIRNTNEYPYSNLYVFIETIFPDSAIARDTVELQLADINGKWLGDGNGKYKYNSFVLRKAMRFVKTGDYVFSIQQGMRADSLMGISDVGIRLEYYQK